MLAHAASGTDTHCCERLTVVTRNTARHLLQNAGPLSDDGLIGWRLASAASPPPKLTRVPAVFVMVTVMSRVPLLMRNPSPWMMGLMGHLCTGVPLCAGWNCQIPPVLS